MTCKNGSIPTYRSKRYWSVCAVIFQRWRDWNCSYRFAFISAAAGKLYLLNLTEMRTRLGAIIGCKNLVPLALSPLLLFVPLKTRVPSVKGDCAYGYFKLRSLWEVLPNPAPTTLVLEGGHRLTIKQSYRIACRRLRLARKLENYLFVQYYEGLNAEKHNLSFLSQTEDTL